MTLKSDVIALYIHPDSGPITPMQLDVEAVRIEVLKVPAGLSQDEAGVREIARQIRKQFPRIDPASNRKQLTGIMSRLSHAEVFNGIVVRLSGSIDTEAPPDKTVKSQLEGFVAEVTQLKKTLEKERHAHEALKATAYGYQNDNKRFKALYERACTELTDAKTGMHRAQEEGKRTKAALERALAQANAATQEIAVLRTQLELAQKQLQERPASTHLADELALLRLQFQGAKKETEQLRQTIADLERERDELRQRLHWLTEGPAAAGTAESADLYDDL